MIAGSTSLVEGETEVKGEEGSSGPRSEEIPQVKMLCATVTVDFSEIKFSS